ncbi:MAG: family 78 glycoside hydrolase catalytic domain, partial [Bacillota bacterium]
MSKSVNSLKFKKLLCENLKNPSGIDKENPRFSWILTSQKRGIYQTGYKILVASSKKNINHNRGDMWDSGKINSNKSIYIKYRGIKLKSDNRYWWKVKCKDDQNNWNSSKPQWFEIGLLEKDDWNGKWIGTKKEILAPLFKKDFNLLDKVDRARLYICGLGYQEIYLNKKKVGDQVLVPNWTDYGPRKMNNLNYPIKDKMSHRVQYLSYNVDNYLKEGNNELKVLLGNGWFNQRERTAEGELWYGTPRLILQMNILLKDDSKIEIKSDKNWKVTKSPITYNNIYYGETYDARLEKDKENSDSDNKEEVKIMKPPGGKLVSQLSPSDKKIKVINPKIRLNPEKNIYIFDLGQNISGWVRLKVNGPAGTRIRLRFAEELTKNNNLDFQSTGGKEQIQEDNYILKGKGMETYEPSFSWHGFRYVEVKGYPGIPDLDDIKGILVHSDIEVTGDFSCSSKRINKIFELYKWSQLTNLHGGVPSDCPHRERLGYTGDGQLTAEAAIYCFDMHNFYEKWINDIADSQGKDTGHVQHTAPFYGGGGGPGAWGCAYILMPWYLYKYYGDKEILEKHYQGMLKWMNYLESRTDTGYIVVREEEGGWCLGDWCTPGETEIPESLVNTFYFAFSAGVIARIADILDKNEDKKQYLELKQMIENKF